MKNNKKSWFNLLPDDKRKEVREWIFDGVTPYTEVARMYRCKVADVVYAAKKLGAPPRRIKKNSRVAGTALSKVDAEIAAAQARLEEEWHRIEELRAKKAELQLQFERDGDAVVVHGVGPEPFAATAAEWPQFLNLEGARKLREFIAASAKKVVR